MKKQDAFNTELTNQVIELLENGQADSKKFSLGFSKEMKIPTSYATKKPYKGANLFKLMLAQHNRGYISNEYATYRQWQELGGQVTKAAKGHGITIRFFRVDEKENAQGEIEKSPKWGTFVVFNRDVVEGLQELPQEQRPTCELSQIVRSLGTSFRIGTPSYNPSTDTIAMPYEQDFDNEVNYLAALTHEAVHATGHKSRLNRFTETHQKDEYAKEELIAELGSLFLMMEYGITKDIDLNHVHYIQHWIKLLKDDHNLIIKAASKASAAVELLKKSYKQQQAAA